MIRLKANAPNHQVAAWNLSKQPQEARDIYSVIALGADSPLSHLKPCVCQGTPLLAVMKGEETLATTPPGLLLCTSEAGQTLTKAMISLDPAWPLGSGSDHGGGGADSITNLYTSSFPHPHWGKDEKLHGWVKHLERHHHPSVKLEWMNPHDPAWAPQHMFPYRDADR